MILTGTRGWNRENRTQMMDIIVRELSQSGRTHASYFKGRSFVLSLLLGRGYPRPVENLEEWNYARITYRERIAFEIYYSRWGCDGRIFDEEYDESELRHILDAISEAGISIQFGQMHLYKIMRFLTMPMVVIGVLFIAYSFISDETSEIFIHACYTIPNFLIFLLSSWKRRIEKEK
ncbi:MAG: hypothetical protein HXS53_04980 [Theionarchaea archaeon]|nr:hypothetical protein [Theionarchaea archaeon]